MCHLYHRPVIPFYLGIKHKIKAQLYSKQKECLLRCSSLHKRKSREKRFGNSDSNVALSDVFVKLPFPSL